MERIFLDDKLSHAIKPCVSSICNKNYDKEIYDATCYVLEKIFLDRKIKCRRSLIAEGISEKYFSCRNYNMQDYISLSRHISKKELDKEYIGYVINENDENAWIDYPFNYPAIVFPNEILTINKEYKGCRIPLEVQVKGDIDLKYAIAISIPSYGELLKPFFENTGFIDYGKIQKLIEDDWYFFRYNILQEILFLKEKYNIDLPIVDPSSGICYHQNIEHSKKLEKIIKKQYI